MSVSATRDDTARMLKAVQRLTKKTVYIGIPAENADRLKFDGSKSERQIRAALAAGGQKEKASNALIGYVQENGMPDKNVPARPFLVPGVASQKDRIADELMKAGELALEGDVSAVDKAMHLIGLVCQRAVQKKITDGPYPPLAPGTIAGRLRRGRTGTVPLIDTGQLRQSITYVVKDSK